MLTLPMIWLGLIKEFFVATQFIGMHQAVLGAVLSYISLRGLSELYYLMTKKEPLGRGDIKFFAMIGAWFGLGAVYFTIMLSSILICVFYGLKYFLLKKKNLRKYFPYGPWIGLSIYIYLLLNF
jgi:leader peptidase (prepilin peptidase)/N-methyltransferase